MRGKLTKSAGGAPLVPVRELCGPTPGAQGHSVVIGRIMTCPPYVSQSMGVEVPRRTGRVLRLYTRGTDPRILADLGHYVVEASRLKRSSASDREW